ncbi:MAG: UDP-2,3-diacylglucosamine diphosphatase [Bacteroidia bacterium]|jgi:UDP-2,3-diacylglucosamine pyrophosphatase LpxH
MQSVRPVNLVILSDVHLGTYGCHAHELAHYLRSIKPDTLVLNGDIIDGWQFSKRYWPAAHNQVILEIMRLLTEGTRVYYITGNHDEMLRRFSDTRLANFTLTDKLILELDGKKAWIFHGDVFDLSVNTSKWLAKIAGKSYDYLILLNRLINWGLNRIGREKVSISKKIKGGVKQAVKYIADFEQIAAHHAVEQGYDYVICGHIHQPSNRKIKTENGSVWYLNSGDWVENLTALEYNNGEWEIMHYTDTLGKQKNVIPLATRIVPETLMQPKEAFAILNTIYARGFTA